ncbi:M50 family metallopeptidase [Janibacter sp. G1551]|uniref:M50 family metallopeptidase n=1 Tax=Janibacter sp. G1551 TaxID=3420440 RepID=UPI003D01E17C
MTYLLGVLLVAVGIGLSIGLHEIGHLVPAKKFGLRVPQYMIGFGPTLWSRRFGETEYGVKAIPLGGYIRMIGMFPPRPGQDPMMMRSSSTGRFNQLMDEARKASLEEMRPGDENRVFYRLSTPKKVAIMMGGPLMNLLIAVIIFTGIFTLHGISTTTPQLASVSECVDFTTAAQSTKTECTPDMQDSPAHAAGLLPGDTIRSINGTPTRTWDDVRAAIRTNLDKPMRLVVDRDGQVLTKTAEPIVLDLPVYDDSGRVVEDADGNAVTEKAGFLGTTGTQVLQRQPVTAVPALLGDQVKQTVVAVAQIPSKLVGVYHAAFSGAERDAESPMSVVGVGRVAGEVVSAEELGGVTDKAIFLLGLIGSLNYMLFVFNMIPLLPLDGGHVAGALWEGLKRTWARLRGLPDPGHVDVAKALPVAYAVASAFIVMTVLLVYADLVNPVRLLG